jgi:hypothetical protein
LPLEQLGAAGWCPPQFFHRLQTPLGGERADIDAGRHAVADLQFLGHFHEPVGEAVDAALVDVDALVDVETRRRDADLPGIAELGLGRHVGRMVDVGIVEHDDGRVAAELHGHALHGVGRRLQHALADRHGAGQRDLAHDRRGHDARRDDVDVACE